MSRGLGPDSAPSGARAYEVDGAAADAASFIAAACDPAASVVVEACAGSGKTWLLVARMLVGSPGTELEFAL